MKKVFTLLTLFISFFIFGQKLSSDYSFYENKGQIVDQNGNPNPAIKYLLNSPGLNVQIKDNGFSYDVYEIKKKNINQKNKPSRALDSGNRKKLPTTVDDYKYHRIDIEFVNSKRDPEIIPEEKSDDYDNYYNLQHKKEGVSHVHRFKKITYKNLYKNIDLVFFKPKDSAKPVEYNFIIHPGGKISDIRLKFNGAKTTVRNGILSMKLRFGEMQENIPNSWIENNEKETLSVNFKNLDGQTFGFESSIDTSEKTIVIDPTPTRIWGSYFGGSGDEYFFVKPDKKNNIFLYGSSSSTFNIATSGTYQSALKGNWDGFVNKITPDGKKLWGTYYGDQYYDDAGGVDFDSNDDVYVGATKQIPNPAYPGNHYYYFPKISFLKLKSDGSLLYEKVIGQDIPRYLYTGYSGEDNLVYDLTLNSGKVYLIGVTRVKAGFSTPGAFQENSRGGQTGFICQFDSTSGNLGWYTYIGGNGATGLYSVINTNNTDVEFLGITRAKDFPMIDAFQSTNNQDDAIGGNNGLFLKFSPSGSLLKSSYIGDKQSYFFSTAQHIGNNLIFGALEYSRNKFSYFTIDTNANIVKNKNEIDVYNNLGTTYIDPKGNIFITGLASSSDSWVTNITTQDSYYPTLLGSSIYLLKYDSNFNKIWGTFYANGTQIATPIKDYDDNLYLSGYIFGNNLTEIATPGTFQQTGYPSSDDMFIAKFKDCSSFAQLYSNSPVCIGKNIELNANGGGNYLWTGPNGFISTLQNPKIPNATVANAGTYTCAITGTAGCNTTTSINVVIGDILKPIPDVTSLPKITGDCKTVINTIPTATDNCKGKISATTSDPLTYSLPGNYTITWKYDDGNGNTEIQTQQIEIKQQPLPVASSSQSFCKIDNKRISDIAVTASNPKWYDASGNVISDLSTVLLDNTKYYVTQNSNGCESAKKEILITLTNPNAPSGNALQTFCSASNPTLKDLKVTGTGIRWYDSLGKYLPLSTSLKNNETYFASQTVASCESTNKLAIKVNIVTNYLSASDFSDAFCNDTTANSKTINLDDYKKQLIGNPQDYTFDFKNSLGISVSGSTPIYIGENIFDVRIKSSLGCYQDVKLKLRLDRKPESNLPPEKEFCDDIIGVTLDAGKSPDPIYPYSYSWNTGETSQTIKADQEKIYSVTITTPFGCQNTYNTIVKKAKLANIQNILITNNSITVIMSESGNYLYSLDEINWQISNKFENLKNDVFTVFVKNVYYCRLGSKTFTIFSLSNIFSPNDDGSNDTWKVTGIEHYPNSQIKIVDKNGRMVVNTITQKGFEWDGKFNGHKLPSDSYWYQIKLSDGRIFEGYVVIKNRN